jgi:hypothetical protein
MSPVRVLIGLAIALGLFCVWYIEARNAALLADSLGTSQSLGTRDISEIGWNGTYLVIDGQMFDLADSNDKDVMQLSVDARHQLIATAHGKSIMSGVERGTLMMHGDPDPNPAFHAEPGDHITVARAQGRLSWPNWFETNWMSGNSPQWKRFVTYRVHWKKASGASLDLFWRFEQPYYAADGWVAANMTGPSSCGLVDVHVTPRS